MTPNQPAPKQPADMTDDELSECFAVEVAGWSRVPNARFTAMGFSLDWRSPDGRIGYQDYDPKTEREAHYLSPPPFATDADAVLPWLEKWKFNKASRWVEGKWLVSVSNDLNEHSHTLLGFAPTFARACCICLILAARARKA